MTMQQDIDLLIKVNSADILALEDTKFTLEAIKQADPGTFDEIIDQSLKFIHEALGISCGEAIERIAEQLGVQP